MHEPDEITAGSHVNLKQQDGIADIVVIEFVEILGQENFPFPIFVTAADEKMSSASARYIVNMGPNGLFFGFSKGGSPTPTCSSRPAKISRATIAAALLFGSALPLPVQAGGVTGKATGWTQLAPTMPS